MRRARYALAALAFAVVLGVALPAAAYASAGNSNPLCYFVTRYSIEWYVLFCNLTEIPEG